MVLKARLCPLLHPTQVPSREIDKAEGKFWTHWNRETKQVSHCRSRQLPNLLPARGPGATLSLSFLSSFSSSSTLRWRSHRPRRASLQGLLG